MAIPTNFQGYTPAAGTTKSFNILGSATVGVWGNDVDGTLTPSKININSGMVLFMSQTYTDAQIIDSLKSFLGYLGATHEGPGGYPAQPSKTLTLTSTVCT